MSQKKTPEKPEKTENIDSPKKVDRQDYALIQEDFVRVWEDSDTADQVAEKMKMPKDVVIAKAAKYRKAGVRLKKMSKKSNSRSIDVEKLNAMIDELRRKKKKE